MTGNIVATTTFETTDPALLALGNRIADQVKLSILKAVANHNNNAQYPISDQQSLEHTFLTYFTQLPEQSRNEAIAKALPMINADQATRSSMFGQLAKVNLQSDSSIKTQVESIEHPSELTAVDLHRLYLQVQPKLSLSDRVLTGLHPQQAGNTVTRLRWIKFTAIELQACLELLMMIFTSVESRSTHLEL